MILSKLTLAALQKYFFPPSQNMNKPYKRAYDGPTGHESDSEAAPESRILNEEILLLVFGYIKWDLKTVCATARVSRKFRAVSKRILWRAMCSYRAPRMVTALSHGLPGSRIGGGWHALAKLMFFCCGCQPTPNLRVKVTLPGHFVNEARFSKTSGLSFLTKRCRGDLLYVSDPCEHPMGEGKDDLGIYRGVFRGFMRSKTRACLIGRQVQLEERVRCPYCGVRVWNMTSAKLVPKTAAKRLGTNQGGLEYFVCINGHMYGACCLVPLTSDEDFLDDDDDDDSDTDGLIHHHNRHNSNGALGSQNGDLSSRDKLQARQRIQLKE